MKFDVDPDAAWSCLKWTSIVDILLQFIAVGRSGDIAITPALIFFLRALGTAEDSLLASTLCYHTFLKHRDAVLCELLQVYPRTSSLHVMENPNAKPDLGDDVGDYDDALAAASAADDAIDVLFRESAASTIGLRLHEARTLPINSTPLPDKDSEALAREVLVTNSYYQPNVFFNTLKLRASSPRGLRCIMSKLIHEARNLPKTPPPSLATYEALYYKATTHGLHATPLF